MAERRMFAKSIIDSDAFLDMPLSTQALYFHLCMRADDEGFVNNPKKIQRMVGCSDDDARLLIAKSFIIPFDSGVVVIKHWRIHNYIRGDRLKPTNYEDERRQLQVKNNGAYTVCQSDVSQMSVRCQSNVSIGESSLGKSSIGECLGAPTLDEVKAFCEERHNGVDYKRFYNYYKARGWMANNEPVRDWKALLCTWEPKDLADPKAKQNRLDELKAKREALINSGASKEEIEVIDLNIQSVLDSMEGTA